MISKEILLNHSIIDFGVVTNSGPLSFDRYFSWTEQNLHGHLSYLADQRREQRSHYKKLLPSYKSAMVFLFDYRNHERFYREQNQNKIASYTMAYDGEDYHYPIKASLEAIAQDVKKSHPQLEYLSCIDTHPLLERDLAYQAGLGWFGKNSMLIHPEFGSFFLIGTLLTNLDLTSVNTLMTDHCGTCTACIDDCPTQAITPERTLIANKCISTYTIEVFKENQLEAPHAYTETQNIFGCDICQQVCPWNKKQDRLNMQGVDEVRATEKTQFIKEFFFHQSKDQMYQKLKTLSNREYLKMFKQTSFERLGRIGLIKNLKTLLKISE